MSSSAPEASSAHATDTGCSKLREIGHLASWSVTSAKLGNGVDCLRDERTDTYWQSDGLQPHLINLQFERKVLLSELRIFLDYKLDESYTPSKISVRAGTSPYDLKELQLLELEEPSGWVSIPLGAAPTEAASEAVSQPQPMSFSVPLCAFFLQLAVLTNHQNGRDTHVREVQVYGPRVDETEAILGLPLKMTSPQFSMYAMLK